MSRADDDYDDRPRRGKASGGGMSPVVIVLIVVGILFCCGAPVGIGLLLPAVQKVREAAARAKDMNNYKEIALGLHEYNGRQGRLPPADGGLSWRVHVLPDIKQQPLFAGFDLQQPWDAPANQRHAAVRVPPYASPSDAPESVQTRARVFTGPDTLFPPGAKPLNLRGADVKDGTSNTFLVVESADAVPWPQPRELAYSATGPVPPLGLAHRNGFIAAFADGSVRFIPAGAADAARRAAATATAGDAPPDF